MHPATHFYYIQMRNITFSYSYSIYNVKERQNQYNTHAYLLIQATNAPRVHAVELIDPRLQVFVLVHSAEVHQQRQDKLLLGHAFSIIELGHEGQVLALLNHLFQSGDFALFLTETSDVVQREGEEGGGEDDVAAQEEMCPARLYIQVTIPNCLRINHIISMKRIAPHIIMLA